MKRTVRFEKRRTSEAGSYIHNGTFRNSDVSQSGRVQSAGT